MSNPTHLWQTYSQALANTHHLPHFNSTWWFCRHPQHWFGCSCWSWTQPWALETPGWSWRKFLVHLTLQLSKTQHICQGNESCRVRKERTWQKPLCISDSSFRGFKSCQPAVDETFINRRKSTVPAWFVPGMFLLPKRYTVWLKWSQFRILLEPGTCNRGASQLGKESCRSSIPIFHSSANCFATGKITWKSFPKRMRHYYKT